MAEQIDFDVMELARRIRKEEKRDTLVQLLALRFGWLSDEARGRIAGADERQLALWFVQLRTAESIDDVFADDR